MVRHHPQWIKARDMVQEGQARHSSAPSRRSSATTTSIRSNVRNMADIGGGAALRHRLLPDRHRPLHLRRRAGARRLADRPRPEVPHRPHDQRAHRFRRGPPPDLHHLDPDRPYQRVNILGTKGRLEVEIPFNAPQGGAMTLYLDDGKKLGDASAKPIKLRRPTSTSSRARLSRAPSAARRSSNSASTTRSCRCASSTRSSARRNRARGKRRDLRFSLSWRSAELSSGRRRSPRGRQRQPGEVALDGSHRPADHIAAHHHACFEKVEKVGLRPVADAVRVLGDVRDAPLAVRRRPAGEHPRCDHSPVQPPRCVAFCAMPGPTDEIAAAIDFVARGGIRKRRSDRRHRGAATGQARGGC